MPNNNELSFVASAPIAPSTFVMMDPNNGYQVVQATGTTKPMIGVAQKGTNVAGGLATALGASETNYAAIANQQLEVFTSGDVCPLSIGAGGCVPGSLLTADSSGNGIVASSGNYYGAEALDFGNSGDLVNVLVIFGKI
jgi:hypothetical protein